MPHLTAWGIVIIGIIGAVCITLLLKKYLNKLKEKHQMEINNRG